MEQTSKLLLSARTYTQLPVARSSPLSNIFNFKKAELPSWYLNKHFTHIIAGMVGLKMDFAVLLIAGIMVTSFTLVPK